MSLFRWIATSSLIGMFMLASATADILKMPYQDPVVVQSGAEPARGLTKAQVVARYGEPRAKKPAVGAPPISSWDYDGYTVYFEGDHVLHAVSRQAR